MDILAQLQSLWIFISSISFYNEPQINKEYHENICSNMITINYQYE